jgi:hypothetical protein
VPFSPFLPHEILSRESLAVFVPTFGVPNPLMRLLTIALRDYAMASFCCFALNSKLCLLLSLHFKRKTSVKK